MSDYFTFLFNYSEHSKNQPAPQHPDERYRLLFNNHGQERNRLLPFQYSSLHSKKLQPWAKPSMDSSSGYRVNGYPGIDKLPAAFDSLFNHSAHSFFVTRGWFELLENTTRAEKDRFIYLTAELDGDPVAFMALRTPAGQLGSSLQGQNTAAASVASLTNWYSCLYDVLLSPLITDKYIVIRMLVHEYRKRYGKPAAVEFNYLDQHSEIPALLCRALRSAGLIALLYHHTLVRYEDLSDVDFEAYLYRRSPGLRKERHRYERNLRKHFQLEQIMYSDDHRLNKALNDYQQVYAKSWKRPERFPLFIPELFRYGLARKQLRVAVLYLDGKPVATELYILFNGKATSYKGAYDKEYRKSSPSTVLQFFAIRHLITVDKVREINLGYGDEPYKRRWLNQSRELNGVLAFDPVTVTGLKLLFQSCLKRSRNYCRRRLLKSRLVELYRKR